MQFRFLGHAAIQTDHGAEVAIRGCSGGGTRSTGSVLITYDPALQTCPIVIEPTFTG